MSILSAAQPSPAAEHIFLAAPAAFSAVIAWAAGVFRPASILGPPRLGPGESAWRLVLIFLLALSVWLAVLSFAAAAVRQPISPATALLLNAFAFAAAFLVIVLLNLLLRSNGLHRFGLDINQLLPGFLKGLLALVIAVPWVLLAAFLTERLLSYFGVQTETRHLLFRLWEQTPNPAFKILAILSAVVVAPVAEEALFRGMLQTLLVRVLQRTRGEMTRPGFPVILPADSHPDTTEPPEAPEASPSAPTRWAAVIISAILFSVVHEPWSVPPIFLLAVGLGYLYERTANLWACIFMHCLFNAGMVLLFLSIT